MIHYKLYLEYLKWDVEVYIIFTNNYINDVLNSFDDYSTSELQKIFLNIINKNNYGFVNSSNRKSIIVINKPTSLQDFVDIYNHEKNHLEMHICEEFNIDPYSEEAAILSGRLAKILFNKLIDSILFYRVDL